MRLAVVFIVGFVVSTASWHAAAHVFSQPLFARRNYRGIDVPVGVGVLLAVSAICVEAGLSVWDRLFDEVPVDRGARLSTMALVIGFSLFGLLDDLAAAGDDRGFRGHLRAMASGRLTTGGIKLLGGGLLAMVVASTSGEGDVVRLVVDALVIALCANLGNLFDRAPGRTSKVGLVAGAALLVAAGSAESALLTGVVAVLGATAGLLRADLREDLMLGDAGANVVGAVLGIGVVLTCAPSTRTGVLVVVAALNLVSE
ncbi:MAG: hypothetical protein GX643_18555, partial [Acidimicrobiales bacterium]|nr:hypothetical protein [Acidimicrobiales bacterium]